MTAGIEIYNNFGTIQINDEAPVMRLRQKLSVPMVLQSPATYYIGILDLRTSGYRSPIVALTSTAPLYQQYANPEGHWSFRSNIATTVTAYCFDTPQDIPLSNNGFQIFNSAGVCMFDAYMKPAVVVAAGLGDLSSPVPAGRTYAIVTTSYRGVTRYTENADPPRRITERYYSPAITTSSSLATMTQEALYASTTYESANPLPSDYVGGPPVASIILDVTGY